MPESGTLNFFYDIERQPWDSQEQAEAWQVLWWPRDAVLERRALPFEASPRNSLPPLAPSFSVEWRLRSFSLDFFKGTSDKERAAISDLLKRLSVRRQGAALHRLLGEADAIQNPVELDLHEMLEGEGRDEEDAAEYYERLLGGGLRWRLLLQLDSDSAWPGRWMWGDAGRIYFGIHHDDLAERRFDKVWLQLQCS